MEATPDSGSVNLFHGRAHRAPVPEAFQFLDRPPASFATVSRTTLDPTASSTARRIAPSGRFVRRARG